MIRAEKMGSSSTPNWIIQIERTGIASKDKGKEILGRIRGNVKSTQFYLFDSGLQPQEFSKHKMNDIRERRQYATVMWTGLTNSTTERPSNLEVYLPQVDGEKLDIVSWPDNIKKKSHIANELENQRFGYD